MADNEFLVVAIGVYAYNNNLVKNNIYYIPKSLIVLDW
jgi:hypothetical protein